MIQLATSSWVYGPINGVQTTNVVGVVYQLIDVFMEVLRPIVENDKVNFVIKGFEINVQCFFFLCTELHSLNSFLIN
jgi:hypothetical protein